MAILTSSIHTHSRDATNNRLALWNKASGFPLLLRWGMHCTWCMWYIESAIYSYTINDLGEHFRRMALELLQMSLLRRSGLTENGRGKVRRHPCRHLALWPPCGPLQFCSQTGRTATIAVSTADWPPTRDRAVPGRLACFWSRGTVWSPNGK